VRSGRRPWWQQATALVTVSTGGVITGFSFVPGAAATMTTPTSVPLHLLALERAAEPGAGIGGVGAVGGDSAASATSDAQLRSAIVNVAGYYLRLAQTRTPAQMEALIWDNTSSDAADHGPSCAAFANLTLELAAQAVGQQSWVSGGSTYPWPLPEWADVRVEQNPASPGVMSLVADAQAHGRWQPVSAGYRPQPGDWVVFNGHVEVVTSYSGSVLDTIGADSAPNLSVNAHSFAAPLADQGVLGFVDNGQLKAAAVPGVVAPTTIQGAGDIPGVVAPTPSASSDAASSGAATANGTPKPTAPPTAAPSAAPTAIPVPASTNSAATGSAATGSAGATSSGNQYQKYDAPAQATPGTRAQQKFINLVSPGAIAAQQRYGVPAAVTIAQAIEESAWGGSSLAATYHNLFGIKGSGPAGTVLLPTSEYENGQWVTINAPFRVYHNDAESIADHAELLATSGYYTRAMADRAVPDAFANDLTGVYATDPDYGANLIAIMKLYNLYRFDSQAGPTPTVSPTATGTLPSTAPPVASPSPAATGTPASVSTPTSTSTSSPATTPTQAPTATGAAAGAGIPGLVTPAPVIPSTSPGGSGSSSMGAAGGSAQVPGVVSPGLVTSDWVNRGAGATRQQPASARSGSGIVTTAAVRYDAHLPAATATALFATAKSPLARGEHLYRDVAAQTGIAWELLAACDWMQCKADPRRSPVCGERIGTLNSDGTAYATKSAALAQCARDLITLAGAVYGINLTAPTALSVRGLADTFAAFRWGAILRRHGVSAMEFPYAVAGLTAAHQKMHWPNVDDQDAPDRPGARFREPFGAVPVVLSLDYPATVLVDIESRHPPCTASCSGSPAGLAVAGTRPPPLPRRTRPASRSPCNCPTAGWSRGSASKPAAWTSRAATVATCPPRTGRTRPSS
jgi:flagellum-specific peptidoglycan hydrolase FlgJ